jgi:hypothetical protein
LRCVNPQFSGGASQRGLFFLYPRPSPLPFVCFVNDQKIWRKVYGYIHEEQVLRRQLQSYRELMGKSAGAKPFLNLQGKEY